MPRDEPSGVRITLCSQHGIAAIQEFLPGPPDALQHYDRHTNTTAVYCLAHPHAQFWIDYHVGPEPRGAPHDESHPLAPFYLFKLLCDSVPSMTWSVGAEDDYAGKTVFGLFEAADRSKGSSQRHYLRFGGHDELDKSRSEEGVLEVQVFRVRARQRITRELEPCAMTGGSGVKLTYGGPALDVPKRFYRHALIDPKDKPHATFRWYYRTEKQLKELGYDIPQPIELQEPEGDEPSDFEDEFVESTSNISLGTEHTNSTDLSEPFSLEKHLSPQLTEPPQDETEDELPEYEDDGVEAVYDDEYEDDDEPVVPFSPSSRFPPRSSSLSSSISEKPLPAVPPQDSELGDPEKKPGKDFKSLFGRMAGLGKGP